MLRLFVSISERERALSTSLHTLPSPTPPTVAPSSVAGSVDAVLGCLGYVTDPERWNWMKSDKNLFNFSYKMKLNANHSLYLWKTLLTNLSAVAGFQLWVSSLAAFCLANRRFSLLQDKEVDVRWLVLVLGCQLITCSNTRQGSRSSPSTVSYVLHMQRCCCWCRFRYSVCEDLSGVVRLSGTGWSKFVCQFFFIFMTRQPGAYTLTVTRHFEKLYVIGAGAPTIWSSASIMSCYGYGGRRECWWW